MQIKIIQITLYFLDINLHEKFISGIDIANVVREESMK